LTISRILLLPVLVATFYVDPPSSNWAGMAVFTVAAVTDFFDGFLARALDQQSAFGRFLDPIADKLLVAVTLLMLVAFGRISGILVLAALVILGREIMVSGLREFLAELRVSVPVSTLAKWKTAIQMFALGFLLVGDASPAIIPAVTIGSAGLWLAALLTLYTGVDYLRAGLHHISGEDSAP